LKPDGKYEVVVADVPWPYEWQPPSGTAPYPTMSVEEIIAFGLRNIVPVAADNAILWLWTTNAFMRRAYEIIDSWGFAERTILTWTKERKGVGRWLYGRTEHAIFAIRAYPTITLAHQGTWLQGAARS
jgi:N6-adenosine-specific RNA methylase IME4